VVSKEGQLPESRHRSARVLHVISSLAPGGAERAMQKVVLGLRDRGFDAAVVSVGGNGRVGEELAAAGFTVVALGVRGAGGLITGVRKLRRLVASWQPDILQGWMYHGNLLASAARMPGMRLAFGIRHSLPTLMEERLATRVVIGVGALLSRNADSIVYNTRASIAQHQRIGYAKGGTVWIPNGFDTNRFRPNAVARSRVRAEFGIEAGTSVVGLAARYHPIKDQPMLLRAAAQVHAADPGVKFLLVGRGVDEPRSGLRELAIQLGIGESVRLVGDRTDMESVINGFDISCLTSRAEGFPNVVGESMACGVPVIATRVGDVVDLVGDAGVLIAPGDADALARGILALLAESSGSRREVAQIARQRIVEKFSEEAMLGAFASLYRKLSRIQEAA
jgi:glycosyltransferase involved in cell wall biosynthesis